VNGQLKMLPY